MALVAVALIGCPHREPPVHFHSDAQPQLEAVDAALGDVADAAHFVPVRAVAVEGDGRSITTLGRTLTAPDGQRFGAFLAADLDGDGTANDVVATLLRADGTAVTGIGVYRPTDAGGHGIAIRGADPSDARCADTTLTLTSPRSVVVRFRCPSVAPGDAGVPPSVREEQILIGLAPTPVVRYRAALLPERPTDNVVLTLQGIDSDGDGRDDIVVRVGAGGVGRPPAAEARIVFFDRAGGEARDVTEPASSLGRVVSAARHQVTARRPTTIAGGVEAMQDLGRLRRVLCADSGAARVRLGTIVGVDCADLRQVFSQGEEVLTRGWLAEGELPAAFAETRPQTASELGVASGDRLLADLEHAAPPERRVTALEGPAVAQPLDGLVPIRTGVLTLETPAVPIAVSLHGPVAGGLELATLSFNPAVAGDLASLVPRSPEGSLSLVGIVDTCTGQQAALCGGAQGVCRPMVPGSTALQAGLQLARLSDEVPTSMQARCAASADTVTVEGPGSVARFLAWSHTGPVFSVNGRILRAVDNGTTAVTVAPTERLGGGFSVGGAISSDGGAVVIGAPEGLWVRSQRQWHRWAPTALAGHYAQVEDLTVSNDGRTVVGILDGRVWVVEQTRVGR